MFHYEVSGTGTPVIFIHGFMENTRMWDDMKTIAGIQAICVDLFGHGKTGIDSGKSAIGDQAEEILRIIEFLGFQSVQIVGHSLGGYVALEAFRRYPEKIEHVTLLHSHPWADTEERKKDRERVAELVLTKASTFIREAIPNLFHAPETLQETVDAYIGFALEMRPEAISATSLAMKDRSDQTVIMQQHPERFTFIQGEYDPLISYPKVVEFTEKTGISLLVLENSAHMGQVEETTQCKALLQTVLVE